MCEIVAAPQVEVPGIMDDLIPQFAPANQKFVDDYNNASKIVDAAARHASPTPPTPAPQAKPKP